MHITEMDMNLHLDLKKKLLLEPPVIVLMLGLFLFLPFITTANDFLNMRGRVLYNEKPLRRANISVWENDTIAYTLKTNFWGKFSVYVPFQREFIFTFSHKNLISKKLFINTITPNEPDPEKYYIYRFEVELIENSPDVYREFFNFPIAMLFFDTKTADFNYYRANTSTNTDMSLFASVGDITFESQERIFGREILEQETRLPLADQQTPAPNPGVEQQPDSLFLATTSSSIPGYITQPTDETTKDYIEPVKPGPDVNKNNTLQPLEGNKVLGFTETPFNEFFNYKNPDQEVDFKGQVFFSVQLVATAKNIPASFFNKITQKSPQLEILKYTDANDGLDKYIAGVYDNLNTTIDYYRLLRSMGYEGYIVAFYNNQRVKVSYAQELQDE
jgi:hypothetical protein